MPERVNPVRSDRTLATESAWMRSAHAVARHDRRLLDSPASRSRADLLAANEVMHWLEHLDP